MRDQTAQKRIEVALRESELLYRRLFESAQDGILILDCQTLRITDTNPFLCELLSYSSEQLKGKELWEIGLFEDKQESLAALRKLRETGYVRYEHLPLKSAHGAIREVELIGHIYQVDGRAVVQCNIRDITERKRMERQVGHLSRLVNDLLDVSRITSGRIHLQTKPVDINAVIERAVEQLRHRIDRRGQQLSIAAAPNSVWLDADPDRLEQVVGNLLDNASKYSDDGRRIALSVEQGDRQAIIRVRDEGEGIDADTLSHVFELFSQAERSLERSAGGLGIGLALVKSLVELHQGSVEVHSEGLGQGSEFVVRLPLAASQTRPQEAAAPPPATTIGDSHLRILVVDDNADAAKMASQLLRSWGHEMRVAQDGSGALQRAAEFCPQVVLLDIGLPAMDGYEVARRMRQDPQFKNARLVAITGYGQDSDRQRSKEAGFDDHLVKPVEVSDLKALLGGFQQESREPELGPGLRLGDE